jgi:hypothetical protein
MLAYLNNGQLTKVRDLNGKNLVKRDEKLRLSIIDDLKNYEREMHDEDLLFSKRKGPLPQTSQKKEKVTTPEESETISRVLMT